MKKIFLTSLALVFPLVTNAQDEKTIRVSVGAGVAFKKNLRVDNQVEHQGKKFIVRPIPVVTLNAGRFSLGAQGISVRAFGNQGVSFSAFIKPEGDHYQGINMVGRRNSFFTGVSAKFLKYGLNVSHDINGRSKGTLAQISYGEFYPISAKFFIRAGLSLDWMDDKFNEYYYGVRKFEAMATRREYHPNNAFQLGINFLPIYKISEDVSAIGAVGFKSVPKEIRNSPTMNGDKVEMGGFGGVTYTF